MSVTKRRTKSAATVLKSLEEAYREGRAALKAGVLVVDDVPAELYEAMLTQPPSDSVTIETHRDVAGSGRELTALSSGGARVHLFSWDGRIWEASVKIGRGLAAETQRAISFTLETAATSANALTVLLSLLARERDREHSRDLD